MNPAPQTVADYSPLALADLARQDALILALGPFHVRIRTGLPELLAPLHQLYGAAPILADDCLIDYDIRMLQPRGLRRWFKPQVQFEIDGRFPFDPHPLENAFPMFEWGLNWCIATSTHQHLMLHAGVVAWDDRALIMPGEPGSGKSTLSAAMTLRGARLLCDEFGLIDTEHLHLDPIPRAIPLKNASVPVIEAFAPDANIGPTYPKTRKGLVRHVAPGTMSLEQQQRPAVPHWVVFPKYRAQAKTSLVQMTDAAAFQRLSFNSFNYRLHGATGFRTIEALARTCRCFVLDFSDLDSALAKLEQLREAPSAAAV